jgi:predicted dehydrogenase
MINIGVIGCGYWGVNYVRVFNELDDSTVIRVCDLCTKRLDDIKRRYPFIHTHTHVQDLLDDNTLDAVVVSTPAITHYKLVRQSLLAGKHVLSEKPLTTTVSEAEELIELADWGTKVLLVGHIFLYNRGIQKMKDLITEDDFGALSHLRATRTNPGPVRQDVSVVWDLASHDVSIFNYFLDAKPVKVGAVGRHLLGSSRPDEAFITLTYPDSVIGYIHVSWVDPNKVREVAAVGRKSRVVFDDSRSCLWVWGEFCSNPRIEPSEPLKNQSQHFLDCIRAGQTPLSDGLNGRDVVQVIAAIDRSLQNDGQPVDL